MGEIRIMNVYIVDDVLAEAQEAQKMLLKFDPSINTHIETDSLKAKENIVENSKDLDLIILDMQMQPCSGIEILEEMNKKNVQVPVIVYSNFIENYSRNIVKDKVVSLLSKSNFEESNQKNLTEIFLYLNSAKSCMILTKEMNDFLKNKRKRMIQFNESLNELKKNLINLSL